MVDLDPNRELTERLLLAWRGMQPRPHRRSCSQAMALLRKSPSSLGIRTETVHPRRHDLRHRSAVRTLIEWQRSEASIDSPVGDVSTYLGHVSPAGTYLYLSVSPERLIN